MRVLIAEDDPVSRRVLEKLLIKWGYEVVLTARGDEAWEIVQGADAPHLLILDWMMPGVGGVDLCRRIRAAGRPFPAQIILLTARAGKEDIVEGLEAGADDYLTKPFNQAELQARIKGGVRLLELQLDLAHRVKDLQEALASVKLLRGLLPICSYCKRIRDDMNYWQQVEKYISEHSEVLFSHGICPECYERFVQPQLSNLLVPKEPSR